MALKYKRYQKGLPHTYTLGTYPTREVLEQRPELVEAVYLSPDAAGSPSARILEELCARSNIPCRVDERQMDSLSPKENCHALAIVRIEPGAPVDPARRHLVLHQPSNPGNLGTILRTALGFGVTDVAIITPAADRWQPSVLRSAMGAAFSVRQEAFASFDDYAAAHARPCFAFALTRESQLLGQVEFPKLCSLVFGPEATGLPEEVVAQCQAVRIAHSRAIDSLNLSIAASVALYELTRGQSWEA